MRSTNILLFIGGTETIFILLIVVMVFGADKLPEIARGLGKGMRQLKDASSDVKREIIKSTNDVKEGKNNITANVENEIQNIKDEVEDFAGSIKRNK